MERTHRWLVAQVGNDSPAIDIGSGEGKISIALAKRGLAVTAVDKNPAFLESARKAAITHGVSERIWWISADAERLILIRSKVYRSAIMSLSLHHIEHPENALKEAWRVLAPGGRLLIVETLPKGPDSGDSCHRTPLHRWLSWWMALSPDGVRVLAQAGDEHLLAVLTKGTIEQGVKTKRLDGRMITPQSQHTT